MSYIKYHFNNEIIYQILYGKMEHNILLPNNIGDYGISFSLIIVLICKPLIENQIILFKISFGL